MKILEKMDFLQVIGWLGTLLSIVGMSLILLFFPPEKQFIYNEIGDFLAGTVAAIAFLWLIVGFFQQQKTLALNAESLRINTEALKLQSTELKLQRAELALQRAETTRLANEAEKQANALFATELHTRRDTFVQMCAEIYRELGSIVIDVIEKYSLTSNGGMLTAIREKYSLGDRHAYSLHLFRVLIHEILINGRSDAIDGILENPYMIKFFNNYCRLFEVLLAAADGLDPQNAIFQMHHDSSSGDLYKKLCELLGRQPFKLATPL